MRYIHFICLILLVLLSFSTLKAQGDPPPPPVFKITFSNNSPKTGEVIDMIITAVIPEGMHMYSTHNKCDIGPMKLQFLYDPSSSFCTVGDPVSIGHKIVQDEIFKCELGEFFHRAEVRQKIKILAPNVKISGFIEGQWCNETTCFNFGGMVPLKFPTTSLKASGNQVKCGEDIKIETPETKPADTPIIAPQLIDTSKNIDHSPSESSSTHSYRMNGFADTGVCQIKTFNGQKSESESASHWGIFILAFLSGLAGLLTPCVFPMIPMTVSFFLKDRKSRRKAIINGLFFGLSIIGIYVVIGTLTAFAFGADAGNWIATHWIPNLLFFIIFLVFAFSFFGAFEIVLPAALTNKVDRQADKGGFYGIFFMALTLAIVSFSCTGPIVGSVLVQSAGGEFSKPVVAMLGFGLAFALPFSLFAIFPNWLSSLPKSGGWLNSVKVVFGFIELALALKFLSIIDLTYHWHILDREVYLSLWIIIFLLMGIYLLGKLKFAHDSDLPFLKVPRLLMGICTLAFVMYMIPGLWGAPLNALSGYLPPMSTQDFNLARSNSCSEMWGGNLGETPKYASEGLEIPHELKGYFDYDQALACAKKINKPLFLDFTGHGCVNCRKMEDLVWKDPRILKILSEKYVIASLYVDDKKVNLPKEEWFTSRYNGKTIKTLGDKNTVIELCYFGASSQPLYCLLDGNEDLLQKPEGSEINKKQFDREEFLAFLERGVAEFEKRNQNK